MRFTLTIFYAFCFPILTPLVGTPTYLVTTNRKSFYLIVVPRHEVWPADAPRSRIPLTLLLGVPVSLPDIPLL